MPHALRILFLVLLAGGFFSHSLAQPGPQTPGNRMKTITPEEGVKQLERMRGARFAGDFVFEFELRHLPRQGEAILYRGTLFGTWTEAGRLNRVHIDPVPAGDGAVKPGLQPIRLLIHNGAVPWVLRWDPGEDRAVLVEGKALFEPLIPGLTYTPFDLQMPFLFWEDSTYEGPDRVKGRPAQVFRMRPPIETREAQPELEAVRLAIDEDYLALLRVELLGENEETLKSFRILNFKKVMEEWIVKSIDLVNEESRDKTRFRVLSAAMGLELDPSNFAVDRLGAPFRYPEGISFESL